MNPQPPVTRIRMAARTSSGNGGALADFPMLRDQLEGWKTRLAATDWIPWLIIGLAALLRFFLLGIKAPHVDEGINVWFVDQMMKTGFYKYDPTNYHGPLHFYVLLVSQTLLGRNVWALRLPVVRVSLSRGWLTLKFEPFVGRSVSRLAALAMAVSPGFVFYGRYSIHEVWLVLFSMLFVLGLLGLWKFGTPNYLWCAGMGLAGMILTKETYIIHLGCALIAYSIGKYKTPWCIISIIWPFLFIFGAALLVVSLRYRMITYVVSVILLCASLGSTIWLNYFRCTTDTEPYVYVQTYNDIYKLTKPLLQLAKRNPVYYQLTGHLIRSSVYPLPWILGDFPNVGYYEHGNMPQNLDADFLLVEQDKIKEVESKLKNAYYTDTLTIRNY